MNWNNHFVKKAKAPLYLDILRFVAEITDGITGLIMLPFNRFGTLFTGNVSENILRWQMKNRKKNLTF